MHTASSTRLLSYLRDCLAEERSRSGIPNVFASRVRSRRFLAGTESASEHEFASLDLPPSVATAIGRNALLHRRDTNLFYGTLFLAGLVNDQEVAAPVLLYPVEFDSQATVPQFQLQHSRVQLNPALFALFDLPSSCEDVIRELIPVGEINISTPDLIAKVLAESIPHLDSSALDRFPSLLGSSDIRSATTKPQLALFPASAILLANKSKNVAGLLHELAQLEKLPPSSLPPSIHALLGAPTPTPTTSVPDEKHDLAPALLSPSQKHLLSSASSRPLTICHGPPGTGKSFTIAATALDHVARQESVLIACRSQEAADVVSEKILGMLPKSSIVVRAGRKKYLRQLRGFLDRILAKAVPGLHDPPSLHTPAKYPDSKLAADLSRLETKLTSRHEEEFAEGLWHHDKEQSFWAPFRRWIHSLKLKQAPLLLDLTRVLYKLHAERLRTIDAYHRLLHLRALRTALLSTDFVRTLRNYRTALGRRRAADQEAALLNIDHANLLGIFPIWITTTDDIHRVLPLTPGLFDLVIIDEATQCDLASPLPILARGKRALLTGDPQQLRHLSFLSRDRLSSLAKKHQLTTDEEDSFDFRRISLIDRALEQAGSSDATIFLSEHFRSLPELIRFSNEHFYHRALHFMRDPENLSPRPSGLRPHRLQGTRNAQGVNQTEIDHAIAICRSFLRKRHPDAPTTIGFLSPFRAQVEAFLDRLPHEFDSLNLGKLLNDHQLIAGTAHSFQGAERDIVLLSFALDPSSPSASRRFLERPDVFNVSITRARQELHLLHSLDHSHLPADSLLHRYLLDAAQPHIPSIRHAPPPTPHSTLADLLPRLQEIGWTPLPHTTLAGIPVDLLLERNNHRIAIDLIGSPGMQGEPISIPKSLLLKRAGVPLYPLSISEWILRKEDVLASLDRIVNQ